MRFILGPVLFVCAVCLYAQQGQEAPEVTRAKAEIEKLRTLVQAGAAPRIQLERAEDQMADAEDAAFLRKTLYGQDLNAEQADEMLAAAARRQERREKAYEAAKKLVDARVAPPTSLEAPSSDVDLARKEYALAETRANLTRELAAMVRAEEDLDTKLVQEPKDAHGAAERFDGDGIFTTPQFAKVETAFESTFKKPLPVSAMGETAVHRSLGFDHRGRVDVAIYPDAPEGVWLRDYLTEHHIPYFAFRHAVPGKATGAHIHIGPGSTRIRNGG
jgi:uncharacterized Zn finger protein (UPF0148 family)